MKSRIGVYPPSVARLDAGDLDRQTVSLPANELDRTISWKQKVADVEKELSK